MMKTKETSTCRKCGGNGKPSKAIMNFHNIQTQDLNKEFETKLLDCIKCESCGHSWIPGTETSSTREQALAWWHQLSNEKQIDLQYLHNSPCRHPLNAIGLTSKEIEKIYDKEVLEPKRQEEWQESQINRRYSKPNQKQYKQFSPELFKSYINKFSDEDKRKAFNILNEEFAYYSHEQMELVQKQHDEQVKFLQNKILELSK